jgi:hypothetical protein
LDVKLVDEMVEKMVVWKVERLVGKKAVYWADSLVEMKVVLKAVKKAAL